MAWGSERLELLNNLKVIETMPEEMTTRNVYDLDVARADRMGLDRLSKELHEVLVMTTEGEAKMIFAADLGLAPVVPQLQSENVGPSFANPRLTSGIDLERRGVGGQEDEGGQGVLSVPILWKMAALMELCPSDVQDMVYQTIDDVHEDYERPKQKIL